MRVAIPKEVSAGERRVAGTPRTVKRLVDAGFEVWIERNAGEAAEHSDSMYAEVGGQIIDDVARLWGEADIVLKVHPPQMREDGRREADLIRQGATLIGFIWPAENIALLEKLAARRVSVIAMDRVPRITRAQKVDALSAMANAAGYRAVIEAAAHYPRFFAGQTTAAGKINPVKVLVIGAGVAGLSAIGAARGLGAIVRAFDTRPEVGEQVRSMGAEFLELQVKEEAAGAGGYAKEMSQAYIDAEMKLFAQQAMDVNIIICTALIPGRPAPKLITAGMVESMREGSVIVDLAAQQGGNCALTVPGQVVRHHGVRIVGYTDLASRMAIQTSWLYGSTLVNMIEEMSDEPPASASGSESGPLPDGRGSLPEATRRPSFRVDLENEIVRGALVAHDGKVLWPPAPQPATKEELPPQPWSEAKTSEAQAPVAPAKSRRIAGLAWLGLAAAAMVLVGWAAPQTFLSHLTVFVLACFVGWQVIWNVRPALHTPLMSVTNAISGIIVLGGMLYLSPGLPVAARILGFIAVLIAAVNIVGGFLVTRRMLAMFHR